MADVDAPGDGPDAGADPTGLDLAQAVAARLRAAGAPVPGGRRSTESGSRRRPAWSEQRSAGDDRDPVSVGRVVDRLVEERGWSTEISVHTLLGRWRSLVGPDVAAHCTPVSYTDGVVAVSADSTAWATQLTLLAGPIVARLNAELGDGTVTRIAVSGPGGPRWRHGRRTVRGGRGPRDTYG